MFGKRYIVSIALASIAALSGILIGTEGGPVISGIGLALLTGLPVFWYESRPRTMEGETQTKDTYVSLGEELSVNLSILGDTPFLVGGVPLIELERATLGRGPQFREGSKASGKGPRGATRDMQTDWVSKPVSQA